MESLPLNRLDEDEANTGQTVSRGRFPPVRTAIVLLLFGVASVAVFRPGFRPSNDGGPVVPTGLLANTSGKYAIQVAYSGVIPPEQWHDRRDFTAKVQYREGRDWYVCTGIVSNNKVITARHCAQAPRSQIKVQVSSNLHVWHSVTKIVTHQHPDVDVAILTFDGYHTNKKRLVLDHVIPDVGEQIRLSGFGYTHEGTLGVLHTSGPLQRVRCPPRFHGYGIICAASGDHSRKSSCGGDSGGPWFQFRDNEELVEIVGVNSFGYDHNAEFPCGEFHQKTGLVSVAYIKDWILQHAPNFEFTDDISCSDSDNGASDLYGSGCDWYTKHDLNGNHCGHHDDRDFKANAMCCHCGGGSEGSAVVPRPRTTCKTIGSRGVGAGHPCVFPFTFRGETFNTCTNNFFNGLSWCATQTDSQGNLVRRMWGECSCD